MIRAIAWHCPDHYGVSAPMEESFARPTPPASADELLSIIVRPVKYFSRMTPETKACLCAASLALRSRKTSLHAPEEIGIVSAGHDGCVQADRDYFRDYVASGRSMGRGNLFIYTLPTSTLGEVAIALSLTGPSMFLHSDQAPVASLHRQAEQLVSDGEASTMLALWSDHQASVCLLVTGDVEPPSLSVAEVSPRQWADLLREKVADR